MEIASTIWIPDIIDPWRGQEDMHSKNADLSNVARDEFWFIPPGVGVEARVSLVRDVIGCRQSNTTGETLHEKVVVSQFSQANNRIITGDELALRTTNTENDLGMKTEAEERKLHRIATVHNFLEMCQGRQHLRATKNESRTQIQQTTAVRYIEDTEEIVKASGSNFQHDGMAAFKFWERSSLPPGLSAKDLPGGLSHVLNVHRIRRIDWHPAKSDEDSSPGCILATDNLLDWNWDFDNPNDTEDNWEAGNESNIELDHGDYDRETPELRDMSAPPNGPGLIRPTWRSK